MRLHGLLLNRHAGGVERRHDGRIMLDERNRRWCSDGFEIGCDNGEKVRVAFSLDCCDREAMSVLATTGGIRGEDVRDLMVAAIEHSFGRVNRLPVTIEWLTDNGSCYIASDTRSFAREIRLEPRTTPIESPQSNGMAEAFVRTIKRDYVRVNARDGCRRGPRTKRAIAWTPARWRDRGALTLSRLERYERRAFSRRQGAIRPDVQFAIIDCV
jgi:putative transposase